MNFRWRTIWTKIYHFSNQNKKLNIIRYFVISVVRHDCKINYNLYQLCSHFIIHFICHFMCHFNEYKTFFSHSLFALSSIRINHTLATLYDLKKVFTFKKNLLCKKLINFLVNLRHMPRQEMTCAFNVLYIRYQWKKYWNLPEPR
jgi:hypothetical protein